MSRTASRTKARSARYGLVPVLRRAARQAVRACRGNVQPGAAAAETAASESRIQLKRKWRFSWNEKLGWTQCPYVVRWSVETPLGSVRIHHWLGPDDDRAFHDHPWWFWTFVFRGGYEDRTPDGTDHLRAPATRFRPALHQHTVVPDKDEAWTLLVTGPIFRDWGFWRASKFIKANKWFLSRGHHPCS